MVTLKTVHAQPITASHPILTMSKDGFQILKSNSFDYDVLPYDLAKDKNAFVFVTLDGQALHQISPCSSGKRLSIEADVKKGNHALGFCFESTKDS